MSIIGIIIHLVEKFGKWISGWFIHAETIYNDFTDAEKKYAEWAYGVVALVNQNLDAFIKKDPASVALVQKAFPDLSLSVLQGFLDNVLNEFKVKQAEIPLTLEDALKELAVYLQGLGSHNVWSTVSQSIGHILMIMFSPETTLQKLIATAEYIYQTIVKPKVAGMVV